jgi:hypothetical protein
MVEMGDRRKIASGATTAGLESNFEFLSFSLCVSRPYKVTGALITGKKIRMPLQPCHIFLREALHA